MKYAQGKHPNSRRPTLSKEKYVSVGKKSGEITSRKARESRPQLPRPLIPLSNGLFVIVDDCDYDRMMQWNWCAHYMDERRTTYYAMRRGSRQKGGEKIWMHREILVVPNTVRVDHINRQGWDNRRSNLRVATTQQNSANAGLNSNNTTGYRGVYKRENGRYRAGITVNGKRIWLGGFGSKEEAAAAYDCAAREYFGEFAFQNLAR